MRIRQRSRLWKSCAFLCRSLLHFSHADHWLYHFSASQRILLPFHRILSPRWSHSARPNWTRANASSWTVQRSGSFEAPEGEAQKRREVSRPYGSLKTWARVSDTSKSVREDTVARQGTARSSSLSSSVLVFSVQVGRLLLDGCVISLSGVV